MSRFVYCVCFFLSLTSYTITTTESKELRCKVPSVAPKNIEKVINECQDEIKLAILSEALESLNENQSLALSHIRDKRETFSTDEKRIAGCLLHCVYRRMNALNAVGFPTMEGLVKLYSENVTDKEYLVATYQAVYTCVNVARKVHLTSAEALEETGKTCDIAYEVFDCISEQIGEYCGQTP